MVGLHQVDEGAARAALDRGDRHDDRRVLHVEQQVHVDELIGEERAVVVLEDRLQPHGPRALIDLVVDGQQRAGGDPVLIAPIVGVRLQVLAGSQLLHDRREVVLRDREQHGNRLEPGDDDETVGVGRMHGP